MPANTILKRTVFAEKTPQGVYRFADWAVVTTTLGAAIEPFTTIFSRKTPDTNLDDFDCTDDCSRIDEILGCNLDKEKHLLGDGVHGGYLSPRTGR